MTCISCEFSPHLHLQRWLTFYCTHIQLLPFLKSTCVCVCVCLYSDKDDLNCASIHFLLYCNRRCAENLFARKVWGEPLGLCVWLCWGWVSIPWPGRNWWCSFMCLSVFLLFVPEIQPEFPSAMLVRAIAHQNKEQTNQLLCFIVFSLKLPQFRSALLPNASWRHDVLWLIHGVPTFGWDDLITTANNRNQSCAVTSH